MLEGMRGRVVEDIGFIGNAVACSEFAVEFEQFDEFIVLRALVGFMGIRDFGRGWLAFGEEGGVFVVEVQEHFGNMPALCFIGLKDGAR